MWSRRKLLGTAAAALAAPLVASAQAGRLRLAHSLPTISDETLFSAPSTSPDLSAV